jgi:hypothetical protein
MDYAILRGKHETLTVHGLPQSGRGAGRRLVVAIGLSRVEIAIATVQVRSSRGRNYRSGMLMACRVAGMKPSRDSPVRFFPEREVHRSMDFGKETSRYQRLQSRRVKCLSSLVLLKHTQNGWLFTDRAVSGLWEPPRRHHLAMPTRSRIIQRNGCLSQVGRLYRFPRMCAPEKRFNGIDYVLSHPPVWRPIYTAVPNGTFLSQPDRTSHAQRLLIESHGVRSSPRRDMRRWWQRGGGCER